MPTGTFPFILAGITLLAVIAFALISKYRTDQRRADPDAPKSALAKDGPGPNPATAPRQGHVAQEARR